jgi:hypothetical protein
MNGFLIISIEYEPFNDKTVCYFRTEAFHSLSHLGNGPLLTPAERTALSQSLERFHTYQHDLDYQSNSPDIVSRWTVAFFTPEDVQNPLYKSNAYLHRLNAVKYLGPIFHALCQPTPRNGLKELS